MRCSYGSSDVCSSVLVVEAVGGVQCIAINRVQLFQYCAVFGLALFDRGEAVVAPAIVEAGVASVGRALGAFAQAALPRRGEKGVERLFGGAVGRRGRRGLHGVQAGGRGGGDQRGQQQVLEHGDSPGRKAMESSARGDRKSGVEGKRVSVRVGLGGRRIIKKKKTYIARIHHGHRRQ